MRDKLIKLLLEVDSVCDVGDCSECSMEACFIHRAADHLIANGVTVEQWFPVSERLPKPHEDVLVYDSTAEEVTCGCLSLLGEWFGVPMKNKVTHWMPLPEAPKEGE